MLPGPGSSDSVQEYLQQSARKQSLIGVDSMVADRTEEYNFQDLDAAYATVRTTDSGGVGGIYRLADGLRFLDSSSEVEEKPNCSRRTWYNWINDYEEAELIDENNEVTSRGEMILETTEEIDEVLQPLELDTGEFYRMVSTQSYNSTESNNGGQLKAFLMYPAGFSHSEIYSQEGVHESTARTLAEELTEHGLFDDDLNFTQEGQQVSEIVWKQLRQI